MTVPAESMMDTNETMTMVFPKLGGECTFQESDIVEFPWGLPGFPNLHRWLPLSLDSQPSFTWLQSIDDVNVALPTADPYLIFEDYAPKLPAYAVSALAIEGPSDFTLLCVIVVSEGAEEMTMNLMAPIIVNVRTWRARQVMLENSGYSVRTPVPKKAVAEAAASPERETDPVSEGA